MHMWTRRPLATLVKLHWHCARPVQVPSEANATPAQKSSRCRWRISAFTAKNCVVVAIVHFVVYRECTSRKCRLYNRVFVVDVR